MYHFCLIIIVTSYVLLECFITCGMQNYTFKLRNNEQLSTELSKTL